MHTLANSEDSDEMPQKVSFHQGLHCLQRLKQSSWTEVNLNLKILTCDPLICIHYIKPDERIY